MKPTRLRDLAKILLTIDGKGKKAKAKALREYIKLKTKVI
jgi:hypothetical protein